MNRLTLGEVGAVFVLAPNSLRVLERIGLHDKVTRVGARFTGIEICHADGTEMTAWSLGATGGFTLFGMHRAGMVNLLVDSLPCDALYLNHRWVAPVGGVHAGRRPCRGDVRERGECRGRCSGGVSTTGSYCGNGRKGG
ncbi:hypothetical protein ACF1FX_32735 [Streptomyces sp. NPDC014646]|uniref:hypothetical protein n=1 Tax=unclassified Streptomyces TaxID=2593676 RepID=UPI003702ABC5